jgi:hypothetical protein
LLLAGGGDHGTPGPALTFGCIAGRDLAQATDYEDDGAPAAEQVPASGKRVGDRSKRYM